MESNSEDVSSLFSEYWEWISVLLFLFITADLLTTMYAASIHGAFLEGNPIIRWGLEQNIILLTAMNLLVGFLCVGFFYAILLNIEQAPNKYYSKLLLSFEVFLGLLISVGIFVFINNIFVIFFGSSLFSEIPAWIQSFL